MTEITILSGKGGTGKSSLSAALATQASKLVVADCDVDASNLPIILQPKDYQEGKYVSGQKAVINPALCINCGQCLNYCRFDAVAFINEHYQIIETACDGCQLCERVCPANAITMIEHDRSRWFIGEITNGKMVHARLAAGEDNSGKLVNIVRDQARELASEIESQLILIDGPPGIGCPAISALTGTDKAVLVTEPTQSGIHDLKRVVELVRQFKIPAFVVINKYDINLPLSEELAEWCEAMQLPIIGKLPFDKVVVDAMVHCQSITDWAPDSPVSDEIRKIWNKLLYADRP